MSTSSTEVSPVSTPASSVNSYTPHAPKYGTVIPNRIFVGGIAPNTSDLELKGFFSQYGAVKDTKIIADRAGVSKGYGFVTFETQEDADKVIKEQSDNLVFKERKLNIGPAIRKQQPFPRVLGDPTGSTTWLLANGVPYTYQNGMAVFQPPVDGSYPLVQQPQQIAYQPMMTYMVQPSLPTQPPQTQWPAATTQWRWATQAATPHLPAASTQYYYPSPTGSYQPTTPEMMYAQSPPTYQTEALESAQPHEGSITLDQGLHTIVSEMPPSHHQQQTHYITHSSNESHLQQLQQQQQQHQHHQQHHPQIPLHNAIQQHITSASAHAQLPSTTMQPPIPHMQHHHHIHQATQQIHAHPSRQMQTAYYKPPQGIPPPPPSTIYTHPISPMHMQRRIFTTTPKHNIKPGRIIQGNITKATYMTGSEVCDLAPGCLTPPPTPELN